MTWGALIVLVALWLGLRPREPTRGTRLAILCVSAVVLTYVYIGLGSPA